MSYELFLCYITFVPFLFIIKKQKFNCVAAVLVIMIYGAIELFINSIFVTINMVSFNSIIKLCNTKYVIDAFRKKEFTFFKKIDIRNV